MRIPDGFGINVIVFKEPLGPLGARAGATGLRDGGGGLVGEGGGHEEQAVGAAVIAEFGVTKFGAGPGRDVGRWRTKSGCSGIKHPLIKYINP